MEQIQPYQIVGGGGGGGQMQTFVHALSGGSASVTFDTSFVIGPVIIEVTTDASNNGGTVVAVATGTMSHFGGGSKDDNVSSRRIAGISSSPFVYFLCDRTNSGTRISVGRPNTGTPQTVSGGGLESFTPQDWPSTGRLRVTAFEDISS